MVTGNPDAAIHEGPTKILQFCREFSVPDLATYGFSMDGSAALIQAARNASSMKGNPIRLTDDELMEILHRAL